MADGPDLSLDGHVIASGGMARGLTTPDLEGREWTRVAADDTSANHRRAGDDDATDDGGIG